MNLVHSLVNEPLIGAAIIQTAIDGVQHCNASDVESCFLEYEITRLKSCFIFHIVNIKCT